MKMTLLPLMTIMSLSVFIVYNLYLLLTSQQIQSHLTGTGFAARRFPSTNDPNVSIDARVVILFRIDEWEGRR